MPRKPTPPPTPEQLQTLNATRVRNSMNIEAKAQAKATAEKAIAATGEDMESIQRRLLTLLAEKKSEQAAAAAMGWDSAGLALFLNANRTWAKLQWFPLTRQIATSAQIAKKVNRATPAKAELIALGSTLWTEEMHRRLVEAYVDTGDLLAAQQLVGVTPSQFNTEVDANPEFAERIKAARKQAAQTLELRAIQEGLGGNDKLMSLILRKDGDDAGVSQLTDAQLARRLTSLVSRIRSRVDSERTGADESGRATEPSGDVGGGREAELEE